MCVFQPFWLVRMCLNGSILTFVNVWTFERMDSNYRSSLRRSGRRACPSSFRAWCSWEAAVLPQVKILSTMFIYRISYISSYIYCIHARAFSWNLEFLNSGGLSPPLLTFSSLDCLKYWKTAVAYLHEFLRASNVPYYTCIYIIYIYIILYMLLCIYYSTAPCLHFF